MLHFGPTALHSSQYVISLPDSADAILAPWGLQRPLALSSTMTENDFNLIKLKVLFFQIHMLIAYLPIIR